MHTETPNPSINRTCPGKPGHAGYLKRLDCMSRVDRLLVASAVFLVALLPSLSFSESRIITMELLQLRDMHTVIQLYKDDFKELPRTPEQLYERGFLKVQPRDRWGRSYVYSLTKGDAGYVLYSMGKDGIDQKGEGDDVVGPEKRYTCDDYGINCFWSERMIVLAALFALLVVVAWGTRNAWRWLRRVWSSWNAT